MCYKMPRGKKKVEKKVKKKESEKEYCKKWGRHQHEDF